MADTDTWFTSPHILDAVAEQWPGGPDCDPCWHADCHVAAPTRYDLRAGQDGLLLPWIGRTWVNPPWSDCAPWILKAAQHAAAGGEVLLLLPTSSDSVVWHRYLLPNAELCLLNKRLKFRRPGSDKWTPSLSPTVIAFMGRDVEAFRRIWSKFGTIIRRVDVLVPQLAGTA